MSTSTAMSDAHVTVVVLCDPETMFADAFACLLRAASFDQVEQLTSLEDVARRVEGPPQAGRLLVIADPRGGLGPDQLALMRMVADRCLLVILTGDSHPRTRARCLATGIRAFLTKDQPVEAVMAALDRVCDPTSVPSGVDPLLGFVAGDVPDAEGGPFTSRERQVLQALVDGESTAEIAARLGVRTSTLRGYVQAVLTKLGVHSRAAAAAVAVERGLVRPRRSTVSHPVAAPPHEERH